MDEVNDIVLGEAEHASLKWAMGMPWFKRFADPASREAAFGDLCIRLEASGADAEVDDLRERLPALRKYADQVVAERDRLRTVVAVATEFVIAFDTQMDYTAELDALRSTLMTLDGSAEATDG